METIWIIVIGVIWGLYGFQFRQGGRLILPLCCNSHKVIGWGSLHYCLGPPGALLDVVVAVWA